MADGFIFEIVGDAGKADKAISGVTQGLERITPAAQRAGQAITSAMSEAQRLTSQHEASLRGVNQRADQLNATLQREADVLARIRGPMRENVADMQALQALYRTGQVNAHEYATEVDRLRSSLLAQNQVAVKSPSHGGGFDVGSIASGLPGGNIVAGALGGGVAGAASAGLQTAVGAAGEVIAMADAYTSLNNRLVALTGSQEKAKQLYDKLHASADKTRSDINTTASSFVQFSRATRDLGVNQNQVLAFTEHLNEAIALSGADSQAAQAGLLQLSQAMASGALRGQDLHSVMEQIPIVAQTIQDHLHVTAGKFKEMADNGEITAKVVFDAFNDAGPKLERQFGQSVPTIGQQFQVLKNDISATVGELAQQVNITKVAADTIANLKIAIDVAAASMKPLNDGLNAVGLSMGDLVSAGGTGLRAISDFFNDSISGKGSSFYEKMTNGQQNFADQQEVINRVVAEGTGHMNEYEQSMVQSTLQTQLGSEAATAFHEAILRTTGVTDEWRDATAGVSAKIAGLVGNISNVVNGIAQWDGALDALLRKTDPWYDAHQRVISGAEAINADFLQLLRTGESVWDKLTDKLKKHATEAHKVAEEYKTIAQALLESDVAAQQAHFAVGKGGLDAQIDLTRQFEEGGHQARLTSAEHAAFRAGVEADAQAEIDAENRVVTNAYDAADAKIKAAEEWKKNVAKETDEAAKKRIDAENEAKDAALKAAQQVHEAWADAAGQIAADLVNAFEAGDVSMGKLIEKAALLALQIGAMQIGGAPGSFFSSLISGIGGGKNGFDYKVGSSGLQLPGFAGGGSITRQAGGPEPLLAMWWMSPNETLSIRTEEQQRAAQAAMRGGGASQVTVRPVFNLQNDRRDLVQGMDSSDGDRVLVNFDRKMRRRRR